MNSDGNTQETLVPLVSADLLRGIGDVKTVSIRQIHIKLWIRNILWIFQKQTHSTFLSINIPIYEQRITSLSRCGLSAPVRIDSKKVLVFLQPPSTVPHGQTIEYRFWRFRRVTRIRGAPEVHLPTLTDHPNLVKRAGWWHTPCIMHAHNMKLSTVRGSPCLVVSSAQGLLLQHDVY